MRAGMIWMKGDEMKTGFFRMLAAIALVLGATSCTSLQVDVKQADKLDPSARVLRTRIEFVNQTYQTIPDAIVEQDSRQRDVYRYVTFHDPMEVNFYSVSGRVAGVQDRFFRIRLKRAYAWLESGTQKDFAISLASIEEALRSHASVYAPKPEDSHFMVEPADTRLARLTLSAGDPFTYPYSEHEAGFIDRKTGGFAALLYVDRPCQITGTIQANDGVFEHALSFDKAGLHWIYVHPKHEGRMQVTRRDPEGPVAVYVRYANLQDR